MSFTQQFALTNVPNVEPNGRAKFIERKRNEEG